MKSPRHVQAVALLCAALLAPVAHAALFRAYLSVDGFDTNSCTLPQPCRLLPAALDAVADGGEVWILDSGNFNAATVSIAKSVTILAVPGAVGSLVAISGPAVSINTSALDITLRNLVIVPWPGSGTYGVQMVANTALTIEDCVIADMPLDGIYLLGGGSLTLSNSVLRGNGSFGVLLHNGATADVSRTRIIENTNGLGVWSTSGSGPARATVSDSTISGAQVKAASAEASTEGSAQIHLTRSTVDRSGTALTATTDGSGAAIVSFSYSSIVHNDLAWNRAGAGSSMRTLGNNHVTDNAGSTGALTPLALQ